MKHVLIGLGLTLSVCAHAAPGRLPAEVVPTAYDLTVDPDAKALTFTGSGTVAVTVVKPVRTMTLNAADLKISRATIDGIAATRIAVDAAAQTATFTFAKPVKPGTHVLAMAWTGKIYQSATGLFAIDYTNTDGTPDRMLATQFEAPDARRFAPMWDEPALKATFRLSAAAPAGQTAFSNMPVTGKTPGTGGKTVWHFAASPKMSSYLLYLGIGNVERKTAMVGNTEVGVITRKGVVGQGDYALASAKRLLTYYNDYFGVAYPLPKLDMIAGPGSSQFFGAMENWGAIFYFERILLVDPKLATESQKQDIFNVVAHEMAHQWFGDLVTMKWWDDLWLNEGFASWMASKASNDLNPDWGSLTQSVAFDRQAAFTLDARSTTHPIIQRVDTPDQISQAFDAITYRKGEAVIRMLEGAVGADPFRAGVRRYMSKHQYANTVTDDLWTEVAAASGQPVKPMMDSFTRQGGVPLIDVASGACGPQGTREITLTQRRFGLDAPSKATRAWLVPVRLSSPVALGATTRPVINVSGVNAVAVQAPGGCGPVVVNAGQSAYFRTRYDDAGFVALKNSFATLSIDDQVGFVADSYGLANSDDQPLERYLSLVGSVPADASPIVWQLIAGQMGSIDGLLEGTPTQASFRARARAVLAAQVERTGWLAKTGEAPALATLRETLLPVVGSFGDAAVVAEAERYAKASFATPDAVPGYIRQTALPIFSYTADATRWNMLREQARTERSPVARLNLYRGLGAVRDAALAQRALDLTLTDEVPVPMRGNIIQAVASEHPALAFDWAVAHADAVNANLEASTRAAFIVALPAGSSDSAVARRVTAYAARALPASSRKPAETTVATIGYRAALKARHAPAIARWAAGG